MDLKNELENEVLMALLTQKRHAGMIDDEDRRRLISEIKGAFDRKDRKNIIDGPKDIPFENGSVQ